jgi:Acyl-coenzyme A:6-aminopenicillanic acid acyl-transferase
MRDLMIGSRRSSQPRPWRAALIGVGLVAAAGVVAWFIFERSVTYDLPAIPATPAKPSAMPVLAFDSLSYGAARLQWNGGIAVLRVTGDSLSLGLGHGRLLTDQMAGATAIAQRSFDPLVKGSGLWAKLTHDLRIDWRLRFLDDGLSEADRAVVAGIVRGAGQSDEQYQRFVRLQAMWDVGRAAASSDGTALCRSLAVIGLQSGTTTGRIWVGHAFAAPGLDDGGEALTPLVMFVKPQGAVPWAALGWPSSAGVATGINAKGIVVLVNPVRTRDIRATRSARPILLLARAVLEQASTLDEAVRILESTATLGSASYLVVDGRTGTSAVVERSPSRAVVTHSKTAIAIGDSLNAAAFAADPENDRARRLGPSMSRLARVQQLIRSPFASVEEFAATFRDRRTSDDIIRPLGHRGVPFDPAAQIAILDPTLMTLWVADPAGAGRLRAFDLRHELEGLGDKAAPPADIVADPELDLAGLAQVHSARRDLRAARRAAAAGDVQHAQQLAARAVARAPALPEALEFAGRITARAGDHSAARLLLQRWIDGGADDPEQELQVRTLLSGERAW